MAKFVPPMIGDRVGLSRLRYTEKGKDGRRYLVQSQYSTQAESTGWRTMEHDLRGPGERGRHTVLFSPANVPSFSSQPQLHAQPKRGLSAKGFLYIPWKTFFKEVSCLINAVT